MPGRRKTVKIGMQLDALDNDEFSAKLIQLRDTYAKGNRVIANLLARDVKYLKQEGWYKYYFLIYELVRACHDNNMYVYVRAPYIQGSIMSALCDFVPGDRDALISNPDKFAEDSARHIPGFATICCSPSLRPLVLRSMMKTTNAVVRTHSAIAFTDSNDIDGSSLGILFNENMIDMADIVLTHKGCKKYMYWKHPFTSVCNDMICIPVEGRRSCDLLGTFSYMARTICSVDQAKSLFPAEFYASLIRCCSDDTNDFEAATSMAARANELVLLPHVNYSQSRCWVTDYDGQRSIILGLSDIQGVDIDDAKAIIAERKESGPFLDQDDFISRCQGRVVNPSVIRSIIHSGASITHDSVFLQRCFQYNSTLFARSYRYTDRSLDIMVNDMLLD